MAKAIGVSPSQIHRFTCPVCEHDQEPTFSIGLAILLYLGAKNAAPILDLKDSDIHILTLMRMRVKKKKGQSTYY